MKAFPKEEDNQNNFISILCNKEQIDLKSIYTINGLKWYKCLKALIYNNKKKNKSKSNKMEENKMIKKFLPLPLLLIELMVQIFQI